MFIVGYMVVEKCGCCFHLVFGGDDELLLPADDGEDRKQGGFAWRDGGGELGELFLVVVVFAVQLPVLGWTAFALAADFTGLVDGATGKPVALLAVVEGSILVAERFG